MRLAWKIVSAGTGVAVLTAGIGLWGIAGWDGETGGHWFAVIGFTFLLPLIQTGSWGFSAACHWAFCTGVVAMAWGIALLVRRARRRGTQAPPVMKPDPPPDPWTPPTAEEMARVLHTLPPPGEPHAEESNAPDTGGTGSAS